MAGERGRWSGEPVDTEGFLQLVQSEPFGNLVFNATSCVGIRYAEMESNLQNLSWRINEDLDDIGKDGNGRFLDFVIDTANVTLNGTEVHLKSHARANTYQLKFGIYRNFKSHFHPASLIIEKLTTKPFKMIGEAAKTEPSLGVGLAIHFGAETDRTIISEVLPMSVINFFEQTLHRPYSVHGMPFSQEIKSAMMLDQLYKSVSQVRHHFLRSSFIPPRR